MSTVVRDKPGQCPKPSNSFGICKFDPENNCLDDSACEADLKCCSEQCNRVCKKPFVEDITIPQKPVEKPGQCPPASGSFGICSFDKSKNCLGDDACEGDLKCCSEQCGRICKKPIQVVPVPETPRVVKPGKCPASTGSFSICTIGASENQCTEDHECEDNMKCCIAGCGRFCSIPALS